jgi:transcriptional regulator with XRE-family HTH domain
MDRSNLSKIERGKVPYDQALLEAAAEAYQCEPADLIMRDPKSPIWSLMDTIRKLPENKQREVVGMLRGFLGASDEAA